MTLINVILGMTTVFAVLGYAIQTIVRRDRKAAEDARKQRMIDEFNERI